MWEALRRLDVLEVDSPESGFQQLAQLDDILGIVTVDLEIEHIHIRESLEEHSLAFHYRLTGEGADVAKSKDSGPVAHYRHQVATCRVLEGIVRILRDLQAGVRDSRRIGEAEILLGTAGLTGCDLDLPWALSKVIVERLLLGHGHTCLRQVETVVGETRERRATNASTPRCFA